jgi:DNA mismatch repair ATPase MutS
MYILSSSVRHSVFFSECLYILNAADKEIEIIQKLLDDVMVYESSMIKACDTFAELDCLLSFAEASRAYEYVRPVMCEDNVLIVKEGRWVYSIF